MQRSAGVLLHLTSLSNAYPIGDLGPAAYAMADCLAASGQRWWQMLPVGPTGASHSPYQALSVFAGNPLLISPEGLVARGFLEPQDIVLFPTRRHKYKVDYPQAIRLKSRWLQQAFVNFMQRQQHQQQRALDAFVERESHWLIDFSLFCAIANQESSGCDWTRWRYELRTHQSTALLRTRQLLAREIRYYQFVQWQFDLQWRAFKAHCQKLQLGLIGDAPLFVAHHSADVWAHQDIFKLSAEGQPIVVAGVPPDYFAVDGQIWGMPVYRWDRLQQMGYEWWLDRLRMDLTRFDLLRLDHFIGFVRTYEIPADAMHARAGHYEPGGGMAFFQTVRQALGHLPFIAEDLGIITAEVAALRDELGIPGIRVLQFDLDPSREPPVVLDDYPENLVVYTGTHDNDTTQGWYKQLSISERQLLRQRLDSTESTVVWAMIRMALSSRANLVIIPMQDWLELSTTARMNVPGTPLGNWTWRLSAEGLTSIPQQQLLKLTQTSRRV